MQSYVALLRAVNVGGTGKLPMSDLKAMCEDLGFTRVQTYIASGNVVFRCGFDEAAVRSALNDRLCAYAGKPVGVLVRTAAEMADVVARNPFATEAGNRTVAIFVDETLSPDALAQATGRTSEKLSLGVREIFVFYPDGQGVSRLRIPAASAGTARNMNTVAKLADMAASQQ